MSENEAAASEPPASGAAAPGPAAPGPDARPGGSSFLKIFLAVVAGGCLVLILAGLAVLVMAGSCAKRIGERIEAEQARLEALEVSEIAWSDVESAFGPDSDATVLQKQEDWSAYRDRKVRWTGTVVTAGEVLGMTGVFVRMSDKPRLREIVMSDVLLKLKPGEKEKALALEEGDRVTFTGVLEGQNVKFGKRHVVVSLRHGEIVGE
jgi:hypothetical protein